MDPEQLNQKMDDWLDQAAAGYGRAKARPGLEERIVANLHTRLERRPWWQSWQVITAAAAVSLAFSIWIFHTNVQDRAGQHAASDRAAGTTDRTRMNSGNVSTVGKQQARRDATASSARFGASPIATAQANAREPLPRLEAFPSPEVSEQDRLLLAYARAVSEGIVSGFAVDGAPRPIGVPKLEILLLEIPKLEIAPIKIEPLPEKRDS